MVDFEDNEEELPLEEPAEEEEEKGEEPSISEAKEAYDFYQKVKGLKAPQGPAPTGAAGAVEAGAEGITAGAGAAGAGGAAAGATTAAGAGGAAAAAGGVAAGGWVAIVVLIAIVLIVVIASVILLIFTGGRNHVLDEAGGSATLYPQIEQEAQVELVNDVKALVENGKIVVVGGSSDFEWTERNNKKEFPIDLRILQTLKYLASKHDFLEIALVKNNAPQKSGYRSEVNLYGKPETKEVISNSAYALGQAIAITAADYSTLPEYRNRRQSIRVEWQRTIHEARMRRLYEEIGAHAKFLSQDLKKLQLVTDKEEAVEDYYLFLTDPNQAKQGNLFYESWQRVERLSYLLTEALSTPGLQENFYSQVAEAEARIDVILSQLTTPETIVATLTEKETSEELLGAFRLWFEAMRTVNIEQWRGASSLELRKAYEARTKIRQVVGELLAMPQEVKLAPLLGAEEPEGEDSLMAPKQIIVFSPEDDLDDGLEENGILLTPSDQGSFAKSGVYFLYPGDIPLAIAPLQSSAPEGEDSPSMPGWQPTWVSYQRFIHIAF